LKGVWYRVNPHLAAILKTAQHAKHVRLNLVRLEELAMQWAGEELSIPDRRIPVYPESDDEDFIQFLGVANAINFCFTDPKTKLKYETEYLGKKWKGSYGMLAALKRAVENGVPILNPKYLETLPAEDVERIFAGDPPLPFLAERLDCLRSAGFTLQRFFRGRYAELFRRARYRAFDGGMGIVEQLVYHDPFYSDIRSSGRDILQFHKRANLFAMMYHGRALASNGALPLIEDTNDLTPPADYEVPRALRYLGIFEYRPELAAAIDAGATLEANSIWEVEIRTQTVAAMRLLHEKTGKPLAALDFKVWLAGRTAPQPHHLTPTTAY